jgi:hypothetical protein
MTEPTPVGWDPCPPGELGRLAAWLRFRRRLQTVAVTALLVLGAGGLVAAGWAVHSARDVPVAEDGAPCCGCQPEEPPPTPAPQADPKAGKK